MNEIVYSIIIPHHNTPQLLQRLLDSIPQREDIEIIIVDDNSSPDIVDFNQFPGSHRADVRICLDKKGGYGGYARNIGISMAKGKWLLFADSDDYFTYYLSTMLDECKQLDEEVDIVFFKACSLDSVDYHNTHRADHLNRWIDEYISNHAHSELMLRYKFGEPWAKLVRKEMVDRHHICFEERSIHNDTAFSYLVGYYARKIKVSQKSIYCITDREGSVSKQLTESKKIERIENFGKSDLFFQNHHIPVKESWHFEQLFRCLCENKQTYQQGVAVLESLGYSPSSIQIGLVKACISIVRSKIIYMIKLIVKRFVNYLR